MIVRCRLTPDVWPICRGRILRRSLWKSVVAGEFAHVLSNRARNGVLGGPAARARPGSESGVRGLEFGVWGSGWDDIVCQNGRARGLKIEGV